MSVEHKQMKLCYKLYTETSSYEKMCMRTRPCKSKSCVEGRLFTVNTHHSPSRRSNMISYVKSCILRRVRKLIRVVVHRFDCVCVKFGDKHGVIF